MDDAVDGRETILTVWQIGFLNLLLYTPRWLILSHFFGRTYDWRIQREYFNRSNGQGMEPNIASLFLLLRQLRAYPKTAWQTGMSAPRGGFGIGT